MRRSYWKLLIVCVTFSGCKTFEVAVDYPLPLTSVHVTAKFEARNPPSIDKAETVESPL